MKETHVQKAEQYISKRKKLHIEKSTKKRQIQVG